jgi:hypothetical protein
VATACTQGKRTQHGRPQGVGRDDQPDAREGQAGRPGEAERFIVLMKPGIQRRTFFCGVGRRRARKWLFWRHLTLRITIPAITRPSEVR